MDCHCGRLPLKRNGGGPGAPARRWEDAGTEPGLGVEGKDAALRGRQANSGLVPAQFSLGRARGCEEFKSNDREDRRHSENKGSER